MRAALATGSKAGDSSIAFRGKRFEKLEREKEAESERKGLTSLYKGQNIVRRRFQNT